MTELLYFEDCYMKEFEAKIVKVKNNRIILDRTAFYPEGGGQPSDTGTISEERVKKVEKKGDTVLHILENGEFGIGETVQCVIDWDRRYSHMKYHTAQHVLSAVVLDEYGGRTTGNQIHEDRGRIDFDVNLSDKISHVENRVNEIVDQGMDVNIYTMDREAAEEDLDPERTRLNLLPDSVRELRIVEIEGLDKTACAGTHVANTEEIGNFKVTDTLNEGKDRNRVEFVLGNN